MYAPLKLTTISHFAFTDSNKFWVPVISLFFQWIHLQNELSLSRYCSSLALLGQSGHPQSRFLPVFYILIYTFPLPFPTFTAAVVIKSCLFRTFLLS